MAPAHHTTILHSSRTAFNRAASRAVATDCNRCGGDLTRLDMVRDGLELEFVSCSTCDTRTWMRNGEAVDLDLLLEEMVAARTAEDEPRDQQSGAPQSLPESIPQLSAFACEVATRFVA